MDIQHLIDRLEQVVGEGKHLPLSAGLLVDESRLLGIVDQLRVSIPEEIKRANRIETEKERILAQAKEESERIRALARQEAAELVSRDSIMNAAQQRAENILERARREADGLRNEADGYVIEQLVKLEEEMLRMLAVVRNGLRKVQAEHEAAGEGAIFEN